MDLHRPPIALFALLVLFPATAWKGRPTEATTDHRASAGGADGAKPSAAKNDPPGLVDKEPSGVRFVKTDVGYMIPYETTIPGTDVKFRMVPIPGGTFRLGSPASETHRGEDEGPQIEVRVEPFWMGQYEVTWGEYKQYMAMSEVFLAFQSHREALRSGEARDTLLRGVIERNADYKARLLKKPNPADAVTAPSELFDSSFTYTNGEEPDLPAVTMSQFAARQYTKWLSKLTGQFFRIPSEAEWEYACRAGTTGAYSFGDDPKQLDDYAWYYDNSDETSHAVGKKKPNPWGLYDMHGNVAEWTLDQYVADVYKSHEGKAVSAAEAIRWPTKLMPRVYRGGSWDEDAEICRSAARRGSDDVAWTGTDPNEPKSPWWYSNGPSLAVGFRVIRPLQAPKREHREKYWRGDDPTTVKATAIRLGQGRGATDSAHRNLPEMVRSLLDVRKQYNAEIARQKAKSGTDKSK
jgi:formylglycine-generating enzyme required for sulfatase activity